MWSFVWSFEFGPAFKAADAALDEVMARLDDFPR